MKRTLILAAICAVFILWLRTPARAEFTFRSLGGLPSPDLLSAGNGISADGAFVAGTGNVVGGIQAVRWSRDSGMIGLGDLPGGYFSSQARAISPDGGFVAGQSSSANGFEAFLWSNTGMIGLGDLDGPGGFSSFANAVSRNGGVVVGASQRPFGPTQYAAFKWTGATGMLHLGDLPGGDNFSIAFGVSDDGSIIVGGSASSAGSEAFVWTAGTGMMGMGDLPGGGFSSSAQAISGDGRVIVGSGLSAAGFEAFRWTAAEGMVGLGDLPGGNFSSGANAVSADGNVIVGSGSGIGDSDGAFFWTPSLGMVSLKQYLMRRGVGGLEGWHLTYARGISADGLTIVGTGVNPQGLFEGWVATIELEAAPVDVGETVSPTVLVSSMNALSGGVHELMANDNSYLALRARGSDAMQLVAESQFTNTAATHLIFEIESRASRTGTNQLIELFDFAAGVWTVVDSRNVRDVDHTTTATISSNVARFIQPGNMRLRARITWRNTGAKKGHQTSVLVDRIAWSRIP